MSFIYLFIYSFIHLFIYSLTHSFILSFIRLVLSFFNTCLLKWVRCCFFLDYLTSSSIPTCPRQPPLRYLSLVWSVPTLHLNWSTTPTAPSTAQLHSRPLSQSAAPSTHPLQSTLSRTPATSVQKYPQEQPVSHFWVSIPRCKSTEFI